MKILFISANGDGLPLALRMKQEGNEVFAYVDQRKDCPEAYEGILPIIKNWRSKLNWADFVVFDCNTYLTEARKAAYLKGKSAFNAVFSKKDVTIAGKTYKPWDFLLATEMERAWGHKIMEHFGIGEKIDRWQFTDVDKAAEFVRKTPAAYVVKVEGEADSDSTYVGITDDGEDVARYLETYAFRSEAKKVKSIEIEKLIDGIEVACGSYFNGKDFTAIDVNFEHKEFNDTPYSFLTGEMGTIIRLVDDHKLFRETIFKMKDFLTEIDFRGNIDVSCIIKDGKIYPLEFTFGRFGYPAIFIEMEGHISKWGDFLGANARGEAFKLEYYPDWLIGVVIAGQGYPFYAKVGIDKMRYMPIIVDDDKAYEHIQFCDVRILEKNLVTTNAYVGCATAPGATIEEARQRVYKELLPEIKIPNTYYREDIGVRVIKDLPELEKIGYGFKEKV